MADAQVRGNYFIEEILDIVHAKQKDGLFRKEKECVMYLGAGLYDDIRVSSKTVSKSDSRTQFEVEVAAEKPVHTLGQKEPAATAMTYETRRFIQLFGMYAVKDPEIPEYRVTIVDMSEFRRPRSDWDTELDFFAVSARGIVSHDLAYNKTHRAFCENCGDRPKGDVYIEGSGEDELYCDIHCYNEAVVE